MSLAASQDAVMEEVQRAALSLIFNPEISRPIFKSASVLAGVIYPIYESFKALETKNDSRDDIQWLTYWTIYASFAVVDHYFEEQLKWIPYFYHAKLLLLLWLQLPVTRGAQRLYHQYMQPVLREYQPKIDRVLSYWYNRVGWVLDSPVTKTLYTQSEKAVTQGVEAVVWFVNNQRDDKKATESTVVPEEQNLIQEEKADEEKGDKQETENVQAELKEEA
eukprot:TRINITY_DN6218_c0_g1_i2.p4 TRINITY_DN6218_c0_g1~~TRINITY_DN6218_c0_g1_i2.p4  ORF type:complete len:220 (-),score=25.37 TRINITY_DN6218_c0_g1_i2:2712-3371(-)